MAVHGDAEELRTNGQVTIATETDELTEGLDIVVEGEAAVVTGSAKVRRIAKAYVVKYGEGWRSPGLGGVVRITARRRSRWATWRMNAEARASSGVPYA